MGKVYNLKAGERRRVLWIFSGSIPGSVRFRAETTDGGPPAGKVELSRRRWFSWETTEYPLQPRNVFEKGFADADYRIHVIPDTDCRITFETRHMRAETYFRIMLGVVAMAIVAALASFIFMNT